MVFKEKFDKLCSSGLRRTASSKVSNTSGLLLLFPILNDTIRLSYSEDGTQVDFFDLCTDIILEFRNICQPFHIWSVCMKITVKNILGSYFGCGLDIIVSFYSAYGLEV